MLPADEGPSSAEAADVFTTLLIDIKAAVCQDNSSCGFVISADSEPPQWNDYHRLNASKMDGKNIDFVNYMSAPRALAEGCLSLAPRSLGGFVFSVVPRSF